MTQVPYFQVDAFSGRVFSGNPAGVCLLDGWIGDGVLQAIAGENNQSETAFLVRKGNRYEIRWFTPEVEVDLCGHATLASGHVIMSHLRPDLRRVDFESPSGPLSVERHADLLYLDFPSRKPRPCPPPDDLHRALGAVPSEVLCARDLMAVFEDEDTVRDLRPDLAAVSRLGHFAVIVTARGRESDFVSRFFAPGAGVPEDPVTGSAHCTLVPFWSERLGKKELHARQLSRRGGELFCVDRKERVLIGGRAVTYLRGTLELDLPGREP